MTDARSISLQVLDRVFFGGAYSHITLSNALDDAQLSGRDAGLTTALVYGTLARKRTLDALIGEFVNRSLTDVDRPVLLSLRMAVYQLVFLDRIPSHAAVNEAVEYSKAKCGRGAAGFTNGVLRSILRAENKWKVWESVDPSKEPVRHLGLRHSMPDWIAALLIERHGFDNAMAHAAAFNERPPLYFRTLGNTDSHEFDDAWQSVESVPGAFRAQTMADEVLKAVRDHRLVVQDLGSQLVGHFCAPQHATSLLDACAGLGGKTLHLAQLSPPDSTIVAVDPNQSKLDQLAETAQHIETPDRIRSFHGELSQLPDDLEPFDRILVDAPCSGLGVIRRHPETRWRRRADDIEDRADLQSALLQEAAQRLRPGGILIYSVCTFTPREGSQQVAQFLADHPGFQRASAPTEDGIDWSHFCNDINELSLSPLEHDSDAFFAARLQRV